MSQKTLNTILVLRNDLTTAWESSTYKLRKGELGLEYLANGKVKIKAGAVGGDKEWKDLPYIGGDDGHVFTDVVPQLKEDGKTMESHTEAIARVATAAGVTEIVVGDIAIVKETKSSQDFLTGYVAAKDANGATVWKAMDGNVDAKNVYYTSDIQVTKSVGNVTTSNNTPVDLKFAGKNLEQIWQYLYATEDLSLTINQPSVSMSATGAKSAEVGQSFSDPVVTITFSDGNYEYGSKDANGTKYTKANGAGVQWSSASISLKGSSTPIATKSTSGNTALSGTYDVSDNIIHEGTVTYEFTGKASCPASTRKPITNLDNFIKKDPNNTSKIIATAVYSEGISNTAAITDKPLSTSVSITGWRSCFWGYKAGGATISIDGLNSEAIRGLKQNGTDAPQNTLKAYTKTDTFKTNKMQQMFFAAPAGKYTSVSVANAVNGAPQTVTKKSNVMVQGFNGYQAVAYDVWYVSNDNPDGGEAEYTVTIA
jgi:hypothetical protein